MRTNACALVHGACLQVPSNAQSTQSKVKSQVQWGCSSCLLKRHGETQIPARKEKSSAAMDGSTMRCHTSFPPPSPSPTSFPATSSTIDTSGAAFTVGGYACSLQSTVAVQPCSRAVTVMICPDRGKAKEAAVRDPTEGQQSHAPPRHFSSESGGILELGSQNACTVPFCKIQGGIGYNYTR